MASLEEIRSERIKKLETLKSLGYNPYPIKARQDYTIGEVKANFSKLAKSGKPVYLVGRVMALRGQGALVFFNLNDGTETFQGLIKKDSAKGQALEVFQETVDIGDFIEVKGTLFVTKRKEETIEVIEWKMLAKSLRSLPDKWHGLQDVEERFRKRYLDSLMSPEVKERFVIRSKAIKAIRSFLDKEDFLEVETSILQAMAGGATATPFVTHHNTLDLDLYLRVAPELDLKKMMIGGFSKVYEIGRSFRNEGIDMTHNPEFTSIEVYASYSDAAAQRTLIESLFKNLVKTIFKKTAITYDGKTIDFLKKFAVVSYADLIKRTAMIDILTATDKDISLKAKQLGVEVGTADSRYKIIDNIYKKLVRPKIIQPTFLIDYPVEAAPLAKRKEDNPTLIDRFQLIVGGVEVVNGFSELNDPLDQRERFMEQEKNREKGDMEAQPKDEEFLEALEYGMPPACGWGMGIDRLTMLLTDTKNIKEVIYFPTMKPKN